MVRNTVLGCLGGALLTMLLLLVAGYFLVYMPARDFLQNFSAISAPFGNTGPEAQDPLPPAPRADVKLDEEQVRRFVRVRQSVRQAIGEDFERLQGTYRELGQGQAPGAWELLGLLRDAGGMLDRAGAAHREALQREGLREGEYLTIRHEVNRSLGLPSVDLQAAARALRSGRLPEWQQVLPPASPENQRVIEPYADELRETAALGLLGL